MRPAREHVGEEQLMVPNLVQVMGGDSHPRCLAGLPGVQAGLVPAQPAVAVS
jgi:hypothetical protein